jgi:hypothetical protein
VQLRVAVAGVVLQELRDDERVRVDPLPGAPAMVTARAYPAQSCR